MAVNKAVNAGLVVAAAGNTDACNVKYPAFYQEVISVGAIDEKDNIDEFSSVGKVDYCAPGVDIISTFSNGCYATMSGTSMAAPYTTGVLALMFSDIRNDLNCDGIVSADEVKKAIEKQVEDIGVEGYDKFYGSGILKAR